MQKFDVAAEVVDLIYVHAAQDTPPDRRCFIVNEIDLAEGLEQAKDLPQKAILAVKCVSWLFADRGPTLKPD